MGVGEEASEKVVRFNAALDRRVIESKSCRRLGHWPSGRSPQEQLLDSFRPDPNASIACAAPPKGPATLVRSHRKGGIPPQPRARLKQALLRQIRRSFRVSDQPNLSQRSTTAPEGACSP